MTDIRVKGFDSRTQLDQYFAEQDEAPAAAESTDPVDGGEFRRSAETELAWLRKEAAELRDRLSSIRRFNQDQSIVRSEGYSWFPIAIAICATFCLGEFARRLRSR